MYEIKVKVYRDNGDERTELPGETIRCRGIIDLLMTLHQQTLPVSSNENTLYYATNAGLLDDDGFRMWASKTLTLSGEDQYIVTQFWVKDKV